MNRPLRFIEVEQEAGVLCLRLCQARMDEAELSDFMDEVVHVAESHPGSNVILSLGPDEPLFLYSVFLAKLVRLQRRVRAIGARLKLADVSANVLEIFQVCHLDHLFEIYPDRAAALAAFATCKGG